jgi:hypothetical protein
MEMSPEVFQRACGGWLAVAPKSALFKIGAVGATAEEATANFEMAWGRWVQIAGNDVAALADVPVYTTDLPH